MLQADGIWFRDSQGRAVMLRGVNLSGSTKMPLIPDLLTHVSDNLFESEREVSFVGRPFPLKDADEHFTRLRHWGFNFLRFNITWEAIEHAGPGIYDQEYLEYLIKVLKKAKEYDFKCFIDPHQDVWSRFSGGSGAPGWTFKMAGLDIRNFKETGAALLHNNHDDRENFPKMIWPTNYGKLACATMFTLFFGGKAFAPKCNISLNDVDSNTSSTPPSAATTNIQDFLQQHYISAILQVVIRINAEPDLEDSVVVGYDTLNEPHFGWIGIEHADKFPIEQELKNGSTPTPFQAMLLGMGTACEVEKWSFTWYGPAKAGSETLDPKGARAWIMDDVIIEGKYRLEREKGCIWAAHGVWDQTTKTLLRPDYFHIHPSTGQPIDFLKDFFKPFVIKYTDAIRSIHKKAIIFVEPPVNEHPPTWSAKQGDPTERLAYAPHWYDGVTLLNKSFNKMFNVDFLSAKRGLYMSYATAVKFGERGIKTAFRNQLGLIKQEGQKYLGKYPCVMGEIGIPYDMDNKHAYKTGDYDGQITAMDANMCALESSLLNFTLWNYCPVNSFKWGDGWNGEDLSIFSYDEMKRLAENGVGGGVDKMLAAGKADETSSRTSEDTCSSERKAHIMSSLGKESSLDPANDAMINSGGRALKAFVRPYPLATPGSPTVLKFDMRGKYMVFTYECALSSSATSSSWGPNTTITTAVATPQMNTSNTKKSQVPPFSEQLDQWCELYLPRIYFPRDADVETFTCHGPATALKFQNTGDWIISTEHQRAWYKCPCTMQASGMIFTPNLESSKQQQQQEPSTSARRSVTVDPSCRHTIVIRCKNNDDNSSGNEKSMEDFAKEVVGGVSAGATSSLNSASVINTITPVINSVWNVASKYMPF